MNISPDEFWQMDFRTFSIYQQAFWEKERLSWTKQAHLQTVIWNSQVSDSKYARKPLDYIPEYYQLQEDQPIREESTRESFELRVKKWSNTKIVEKDDHQIWKEAFKNHHPNSEIKIS